MSARTRKLVSVSALAVSDVTPPLAVVEYINETGEHVETFTSDKAAWDRYNVLMTEMGMRRI
jgi:hypothetical protein